MFYYLVLFCGLGVIHVSHAIINGEDADIKNYPYAVSIESLPQKGAEQLPTKVFMGNGALITPKVVLTAYECGMFCSSFGCEVRAGHVNTFSGGQLLNMSTVTSPAQAECSQYLDCLQYDISLLTLERPFRLTNRVQTIRLPYPSGTLPVGTTLSVVGWGGNHLQKSVSPKLIEGTTKILPFSTCRKENQHISSRRNICVGPEFCLGDTGSAAVYEGRIIGVATFIDSCEGVLKNASVLVDISSHLDWIQAQIEH